MPSYRLTFGQQYRTIPHPTAGALAHPDGWWTIVADNEAAARNIAVSLCGRAWSNLYSGALEAAYYPRGELLRLIDPASTQAVALLRGPSPDGTGALLVHVWADGTGEAALDAGRGWGAPSRLEVAP